MQTQQCNSVSTGALNDVGLTPCFLRALGALLLKMFLDLCLTVVSLQGPIKNFGYV